MYFTQDPLYICNSNAIHGLYTISIDISRIYSNCYINIWVFLSDIYLCINQELVINNWPPWSRGSTFLLALGPWVSELWSYNLLMWVSVVEALCLQIIRLNVFLSINESSFKNHVDTSAQPALVLGSHCTKLKFSIKDFLTKFDPIQDHWSCFSLIPALCIHFKQAVTRSLLWGRGC